MSSPPVSASHSEFIDRLAGRVFLISTAVFILLSIGVSFDLTDSLDQSLVVEWNPDDVLGARQEAARDITTMGGYTFLAIFVTVFCVYLRASGQTAAMWYVILTVLNAYIVLSVLKRVFDRARPEGVLHLSYVESASFPSGHAMMSAVTYVTVAMLLTNLTVRRKYAVYLLVLAALLTLSVGLSRVYLGVHYPTDVLAGWSAGLSWCCGARLLAERLTSKQTIPPIQLSRNDHQDSL